MHSQQDLHQQDDQHVDDQHVDDQHVDDQHVDDQDRHEQDQHVDGQGEDVTTSPDAGLGDHATGDIVIDSALQDLRDAPADDLDAQIEAGRRVHQTLHGRLSDLGGE